MSRQLRCPNCGGEHTLVNPGITMLVCDFCKTVVYWDEETALKTGSQSILPEGDTRLYMHATGKLGGRPYEVVGHLRYDHGRGSWDEWYLQLGDGSVAWLSEDERELSFERPVVADGPVPPPSQLRVGMAVSLAGVQHTVREVGRATCVGGEGQLPFTILPGEQYPYADLASLDGTRFATLEYDEGSRPTCFAGQVLGHADLTVDDERPPSTAGATEGRHIKCPNCNAPLEVTAKRQVETLVCPYCGAQNDLTGAEARVMGISPPDQNPGFAFEIGQAGVFEGRPHEVFGRMLYEDDEGYLAREYLLHNPESGYLWLEEANQHFVLNRPTQTAPSRSPFNLVPKHPVPVGKEVFLFYEQGTSRLVYVDGSLPWLARTGDRNTYVDLIAPPRMFCVESDGQEVEYFIGRYMSPGEVWQAFGAPGPAPPAHGIHPAQPFLRGPLARALMTLGAVFAAVNLLLLLWSAGSSGRVIFSQEFDPGEYLEETTSKPFTVGPEKIMGLELSAPLNNSWIGMQVALVNAKDEVVEELEGDISYYQGVEGGESWSEGSRTSSTFGTSPPPGSYRLILKGSGGTSETGPPGQEKLKVTISQGIILSRYFVAVFCLTLAFFLFEVARQRMFETRRWADVIEDDDDDDD